MRLEKRPSLIREDYLPRKIVKVRRNVKEGKEKFQKIVYIPDITLQELKDYCDIYSCKVSDLGEGKFGIEGREFPKVIQDLVSDGFIEEIREKRPKKQLPPGQRPVDKEYYELNPNASYVVKEFCEHLMECFDGGYCREEDSNYEPNWELSIEGFKGEDFSSTKLLDTILEELKTPIKEGVLKLDNWEVEISNLINKLDEDEKELLIKDLKDIFDLSDNKIKEYMKGNKSVLKVNFVVDYDRDRLLELMEEED